MRRANESLIRERHQIPKLEKILPELNNAKYFSKIDLQEGYHQIKLDLSSRHVTAFITHEGTFQSKRLVYGAKPAFENFQKDIEQTNYFCRLKINKQGNYTSFIKSRCCDKGKSTNKCNRSKTFLGLVNYCSQSITGYAELTELLRKLTKKNAIFKWSNKH